MITLSDILHRALLLKKPHTSITLITSAESTNEKVLTDGFNQAWPKFTGLLAKLHELNVVSCKLENKIFHF